MEKNGREPVTRIRNCWGYGTNTPLLDHESSVLLPFLSPSSVSTSSSCTRCPSAVEDGLGRQVSVKVPFAHRNP